MAADLAPLSLPELEELLARIRAEIEIREREPSPRPILKTRARRALEEQAAREASESPAPAPEAAPPAEVEAAVEPPPAEAAATPPGEPAAAPIPQDGLPEPEAIKYMHPSNRQLTWSGEGSKPAWVEIWLYTGGTLYALEVAAEKLRARPRPQFDPLPSEETPPPARRRRGRRGRHTA